MGTIDLGAVTRTVAQVTLSGDTPTAYSLSNGTLVVPLISRSSPDQNNFLQTLAVSAPAGNIEVNNTNTASFFNIQGLITATTFTHTGTGRTVLGLFTGLTSASNSAVNNWVINGGVLENAVGRRHPDLQQPGAAPSHWPGGRWTCGPTPTSLTGTTSR